MANQSHIDEDLPSSQKWVGGGRGRIALSLLWHSSKKGLGGGGVEQKRKNKEMQEGGGGPKRENAPQ